MKLVTVAEMRALEQAAVEAGTPEAQLMEEAGLAVAQEAWMTLGTLEGRRIVVLIGPGNNGGDGIVAARHLHDWGAEVIAYLPRKRRDETMLEELTEREITIGRGEEDEGFAGLEMLLTGADMIIDALLGIGQERPLDPAEAIAGALIKVAGARKGYSPPKLIAIDVPTGVNADSGTVDPLSVAPDLTVTFGLPKVGMYQSPASGFIGRVQVIDIGIPKAAQESVELELLTVRWARDTFPARPEGSNKGTFGRVLIAGGSRQYVGAPRLAAEAAYRAGAGLVTVACPVRVQELLAGALPEATWLPQAETADGGLGPEAVMALRPVWPDCEAAVIGPGIGDSAGTRAIIWAMLPDLAEDLRNGVVFDADALNAIATMPDAPGRMPAKAVLTPHPGEMARLMGMTVAEVQSARLQTARAAAAKFGCTVVLKGAHTVIADAQGQARLSPFANPLLATAGSGDVLAGVIGAYLAQGLAPFDAACLGAYVHAATGEALREEYGSGGLLASELSSKLPTVVKELSSP